MTALMDLDDAALLQRIAGEDVEALSELFLRYGSRVQAYVRAMAGPRFPAEDATQEIFLALWRKAALFNPEAGEPAGWIFTLTRHKVIDIQRSLGRVKEDGSLDLELLNPNPEPEDPTLAPSLEKALAMLPPEQQQPIRLAYYGDLTYDETAKALGLPLGTLKTRIRNGLAALRGLMGGGRP